MRKHLSDPREKEKKTLEDSPEIAYARQDKEKASDLATGIYSNKNLVTADRRSKSRQNFAGA
jgi:hypothetical protein